MPISTALDAQIFMLTVSVVIDPDVPVPLPFLLPAGTIPPPGDPIVDDKGETFPPGRQISRIVLV
jgi:hypothetical protein